MDHTDIELSKMKKYMEILQKMKKTKFEHLGDILSKEVL